MRLELRTPAQKKLFATIMAGFSLSMLFCCFALSLVFGASVWQAMMPFWLGALAILALSGNYLWRQWREAVRIQKEREKQERKRVFRRERDSIKKAKVTARKEAAKLVREQLLSFVRQKQRERSQQMLTAEQREKQEQAYFEEAFTSLGSLSEEQLSSLLEEIFEAQGYLIEANPAPGEWTLKNGSLPALARCLFEKRGGISGVRAFWEALCAERAENGVLISLAGFTPDAVIYASGKPIFLADRHQLILWLRKLEEEG